MDATTFADADLDLTPPKGVREAAARGLELRRKHGRGGTAVGVARARDLSNGKAMSPETISRMVSFFARHEKNKEGDEDDAGRIAWLLWGGDPGKRWAETMQERIRSQADEMRLDGFALPRPRDVPSTGGKIVTMVLAIPGVLEGYPGGPQYVPASTLRDPEYIAALQGVPVVDDDEGAHHEGVDTRTIERESIGRILRAWWDDDQQALMAEAVIDVQRGLDAIAAGVVGVSPAYSVWVQPEEGEIDGKRYTRVQRRRFDPNNVAITSRPRGIRTHLRADSMGAPMTSDLARLLLGVVADTDARSILQRVADSDADADDDVDPIQMLARAVMDLKARIDESEGERRKLREEVDAMRAEESADMDEDEAADEDEGADGDQYDTDDPEKLADSAGSWSVAVRAASAAGVTIADDATLVDVLRTSAKALDVRHADSLHPSALVSVLDFALREERVADAWSTISRNTTQGGGPAEWPVR